MPVLRMQESSWDDTTKMPLVNGEDASNARQSVNSFARSQDDARVSYVPRSQGELGQQQYAGLQQALTVSEIEREFHRLTFEDHGDKDTRNLWETDKRSGGDGTKGGIYVPLTNNNPWMPREDNWGASNQSLTDLMHVVTRRRPGSFPGTDLPPVMSPHSTDTGNLGVNMAEYVLGNSPMGKELENRLQEMQRFVGGDADNAKLQVDKNLLAYDVDMTQEHEQESLHLNGNIQNGFDEKTFSRAPGSRQNSPTSVELTSLASHAKKQQHHHMSISDSLLQSCQQTTMLPPSLTGMTMNHLSLDVPSYEMIGCDPFQTGYPSHMLPPPPIPPPPTMDSPNFNMDLNQQVLQARQQSGQIALLPQQQYALSAEQLMGMATYASPTAACLLNSQDAYGCGMSVTGQTVMPQYYGITQSWPIYPNGAVLQQQPQQQMGPPPPPPTGGTPQPQMLRNQNTRPLTPASVHDSSSMQTAGSGYQILTTPAYYDQNGQLLMGGGRGIGQFVRLVSPGPLLMNTGQQGFTPSGNLYTPQSSAMFNPCSNTAPLWLNPQQQGYASAPAAIGSSVNQGGLHVQQQLRRDSLGSQDFKQLPLTTNFNNFYGANMSPGGTLKTMTPPLSLTNGTRMDMPGISLSSGGRFYSTAPGAETKFRNGSTGGSSNGLFGASLFNVQPLIKGEGISKESTGRSQLLEEFRSNRIPNLQLRDLTNHVVEFSQDQHGSRFIQQKLEHTTSVEKAMVFTEILSSAYGLMTDVFGNYVIQKFFEFGSQEQKQTLAQRVRGHVLTLALHMYGCRVIQKALESVPSEMQVEIVKELDGHIIKCVKDQNGNHVVQKCIESIEPKHLAFITDAFRGQVLNLAMHPYGCRVIQRILEHCTSDQMKPIMDELLQQMEHLVHDQYGNYVIQHVMEHGQAEDKSKIISRLRGKMMVLSQHKFASNVVEKCVSHSSRAERANIIEEVCNMNDGTQSALYTMMKDQFANYVVQKMIDLADPPQRKLLLQKIRPHVAILRRYAYGKHILAKLEKFYMKNNAELGPIGVVPVGSTVM